MGPFGSPNKVEPPSAVGVVGAFSDLALMDLHNGGA
ncbi:MAG: hypothetical protein QOJ26_921 [Thermoplasmata archaeon]|jgi:hypothetical protein|nr:hypothetical protein [Thermoplasmata archaeon]MEA3166052.1 hypothetical protein [Thermoplasmata archaeon]